MHTCDVVLFLLKSWKAKQKSQFRWCVSKCPCLYPCDFRHGKLFHNLPTSQPGITNLNQVTWSISPWVPPSPLFPSKRRWSLVTSEKRLWENHPKDKDEWRNEFGMYYTYNIYIYIVYIYTYQYIEAYNIVALVSWRSWVVKLICWTMLLYFLSKLYPTQNCGELLRNKQTNDDMLPSHQRHQRPVDLDADCQIYPKNLYFCC